MNTTAKLAKIVLPALLTLSTALLTATSAQATTDASQARKDGYWRVEPGQWLGRIVARLEPDAAKRSRLMEEIVFLNPQGFVNADPNRMRAGAELKLPEAYVDAPVVAGEPEPAATPEPAEPQAAQAVGRVTVARGEVTATDLSGRERPLRRRSYIQEGDTLSTSANSAAHVRFNDGAQIALRRNSSLRVDNYRWQGNEDGSEKAVLSLIKGGFRTVTGAIGRNNRDNYLVNSDFATIGIRGTHYALMACVAGACQGYNTDGSTPEEGLYGGTAFGAIGVNDQTIGAQEYFFHDGQDLDLRFEPPPFLFAADTSLFDSGENGGADGDIGDTSGEDDSDNFSSDGNTESGGLAGQIFQPTGAVFTEGEQELARREEESGQIDFDPFNFDFTGDLSNLEAIIGSFLASFGNFAAAPGGSAAYGAWVEHLEPIHRPEDAFFHVNGGNDFFFTGTFGGKSNVLAAALSEDTDMYQDLTFFLGPPGGTVLASQTVSETGFTAHLGRWDANALLLQVSEGELVEGPLTALAGEYVYSFNVTPESQLMNMSGAYEFQNVATLGSDELGQGFAGNYMAGDVKMSLVADFTSMQIFGGDMNINDASGRQWQLFQSGTVPLEIDAELIMSGYCFGCNGSSDNANGWMFFTALGPNAEGGMGSFGAHAYMGPEAIAGVNVFTNVGSAE